MVFYVMFFPSSHKKHVRETGMHVDDIDLCMEVLGMGVGWGWRGLLIIDPLASVVRS